MASAFHGGGAHFAGGNFGHMGGFGGGHMGGFGGGGFGGGHMGGFGGGHMGGGGGALPLTNHSLRVQLRAAFGRPISFGRLASSHATETYALRLPMRGNRPSIRAFS